MTMSYMVPRQLLQSTFNDTFPDWLRYRDHLLWCQVMSGPGEESSHFRLCLKLWNRIAAYLQQQGNVNGVHQYPGACSYARCPDPLGMSGSQFACAHCATLYCSTRCQTLYVQVKLRSYSVPNLYRIQGLDP